MSHRRGFSLVEVLVAGILAAGLAIATASSLSSVLRARARAEAREAAFSRADLAASRVARDLVNLTRDPDLLYSHLTLHPSFGAEDRSEILMLIRSLTPVRNLEGVPEGGSYEVQYRIMQEPDERLPSLWRRVDPAMDPVLDGGGIATALVPGVIGLRLEAYDGADWFEAWNSDADGIPHAVRVMVTAADDSGATRAVARRIVALDRVPLPPNEEAEGSTQPSGPSRGSSGASGAPGDSGSTAGGATQGGTTGGTRP